MVYVHCILVGYFALGIMLLGQIELLLLGYSNEGVGVEYLCPIKTFMVNTHIHVCTCEKRDEPAAFAQHRAMGGHQAAFICYSGILGRDMYE